MPRAGQPAGADRSSAARSGEPTRERRSPSRAGSDRYRLILQWRTLVAIRNRFYRARRDLTSSRGSHVILVAPRGWGRHSTHTRSSLNHTATAGTTSTRLAQTSRARTRAPAPGRPCFRSFPGGDPSAFAGAGLRPSPRPSLLLMQRSIACLFDSCLGESTVPTSPMPTSPMPTSPMPTSLSRPPRGQDALEAS